jgi:Flp pilus assembly protein TadG
LIYISFPSVSVLVCQSFSTISFKKIPGNSEMLLYNVGAMKKDISNRIPCPKAPRHQHGEVLVEFVAAFVFLLIMLFGIIQYSLIISSLNTLQQVTREGARFYAVHYSDANAGASIANAEMINYMQTVASGSFLQSTDISNTTVSVVSASTTTTSITTSASPVTVSITYNMGKRTFFGGFVPGVTKGTNTVTRSTTILLE